MLESVVLDQAWSLAKVLSKCVKAPVDYHDAKKIITLLSI
jgi:hypothetical protein